MDKYQWVACRVVQLEAEGAGVIVRCHQPLKQVLMSNRQEGIGVLVGVSYYDLHVSGPDTVVATNEVSYEVL